jgi:hypothetical protein
MRHEFLVSKAHSKQANARTVLITNLPPELDTDHALVDWASFVPGGIERTWIYRDTRDLNKLFDEREKACAKLEKVTSHLLRSANHAWSQKKADHRREVKRLQQTRNQELGALERAQRKGRMSADVDPEQVVGGPAQVGVDEHDPVAPAASWGFMQELVPVEKRPQIRPGKLGWAFIGQKHDSYQYYKVCRIGRCAKHVAQCPCLNRKRLRGSTKESKLPEHKQVDIRAWGRHSSSAICNLEHTSWRNASATTK